MKANESLTGAAQNELFTGWIEEHGSLLSRIARVYACAGDHQDLLQDLMIAVWNSAPLYRGQAGVSTFIYRVALNRVFNSARASRRYRDRHTQLSEVQEPLACSAEGREDRIGLLYAAIAALPKVDRSLALMYLDEMSYGEMADVLGMTATNVGARLTRIRKRLTEGVIK